MMVQRGSSDLHLRVGEPPIVRVDGEMVRIPDTRRAARRGELEALVKSIMPDAQSRRVRRARATRTSRTTSRARDAFAAT